MNPEEGELRPQLLDRFGLSVVLANPRDPQQRQAILRTRLAFDEDPHALAAQHADALHQLADTVAAARAALPLLTWSDAVLAHAAQLALAAGVDGMRADLVMLRAARALAALEGRAAVTVTDVDAVAELALVHRRVAGGASAGTVSSAVSSAANSATTGSSTSAPPSVSRPNTKAAPSGGTLPQDQPPPEGDWGAMAALPSSTTRVASIGAWPAKKA